MIILLDYCCQNFLTYSKNSRLVLQNTPAAFLYKDKNPLNECPGYHTKLFDVEAPALELWRMRSTPSLPLFPGPLWPGEVAPDRILSMGKIELLDI